MASVTKEAAEDSLVSRHILGKMVCAVGSLEQIVFCIQGEESRLYDLGTAVSSFSKNQERNSRFHA